MPELPEVETVCRGLAHALVGSRITALDVHRAGLRFPFPKDLKKNVVGQKITGIARRAKYILMALDGGKTLLLHLGMSGRLVLDNGKTPKQKHDHVVFWFGAKKRVLFNDPRRFGMLDCVSSNAIPAHKLLHALGPEPFDKTFSPAYLYAACKGKKQAIKLAIMDQCLVVGVGNIYASEALFYAGINPKRAAGSVTEKECAALVAAIRKVLKRAIDAGGSSLRDYVQADGELGHFQNEFAVYGRTGEKCKNCTCAIKKTGGIKQITQGGRSTFFCPQKQK